MEHHAQVHQDGAANGQQEKQRMGRGTRTIVGLAVLTALEFLAAVGLTTGLLAVLAAIAIAKTWLILDYFMHVRHLWRSEE